MIRINRDWSTRNWKDDSNISFYTLNGMVILLVISLPLLAVGKEIIKKTSESITDMVTEKTGHRKIDSPPQTKSLQSALALSTNLLNEVPYKRSMINSSFNIQILILTKEFFILRSDFLL